MERIVRKDIERIAAAVKPLAPALAGKTVLLSGGAGFLGRYFLATFRHLNRHVLSAPVRVIAVDSFITGQEDGIFSFKGDENIKLLWGDVRYPLPLREPVDFIIHAAGLASPVYYQRYPLETIDSAVRGTENLLELALKQEREQKHRISAFFFFSSSEIYGNPEPSAIPTPETYHGRVSSVGPRACYDESKRLAETICQVYHEKFHLPTLIVRPFNVFGPGMRFDDHRVMPMFAVCALRRLPLPVFGSGQQTRTFCYITDAMDGFLRVLLRGRPGEVYNIGNGDGEIEIRELAQLFVELVSSKLRACKASYPQTYPAGEPQRRCPDIRKARRELGFVPRVTLREGLARFLRWAAAQESYLRAPLPNHLRLALEKAGNRV
jgi:UDP-glucuronate decarboxylase